MVILVVACTVAMCGPNNGPQCIVLEMYGLLCAYIVNTETSDLYIHYLSNLPIPITNIPCNGLVDNRRKLMESISWSAGFVHREKAWNPSLGVANQVIQERNK